MACYPLLRNRKDPMILQPKQSGNTESHVRENNELNGVPTEVINKAFIAGNVAVQMLSQKKDPSEEGLTG